jgi:ribosome-binding ATPase YchF (GTP1/OBG family)
LSDIGLLVFIFGCYDVYNKKSKDFPHLTKTMNETATKQDLDLLSQDISKLSQDISKLSQDISRMFLENNIVLVNMMDEKIAKNNIILVNLIDKKIKDNNEYIFSEFNDQTERILSLFKGVVRVRRDDTFSMSF